MSDEALQGIYGVLGMLEVRRQGHALTQLEVLHFAGWLPYCTREEFDNYRAEHPELVPFPLYDFGSPR